MPTDTMTSLYVVSEYLMFGYGLENLLRQSQTQATVVGHAANVTQAVEQLQTLQPDIVILYSHEPLAAGAYLATCLLDFCPAAKIISISVDDNTMYSYQVTQHRINRIEDLIEVIPHSHAPAHVHH
jgi:DNA-binding NarL/FixJ family response regulator